MTCVNWVVCDQCAVPQTPVIANPLVTVDDKTADAERLESGSDIESRVSCKILAVLAQSPLDCRGFTSPND